MSNSVSYYEPRGTAIDFAVILIFMELKCRVHDDPEHLFNDNSITTKKKKKQLLL